MGVTLPQSQVWAEFDAVIPIQISKPLLPQLVGPQAGLHRYNIAAEKALIGLGAYNPTLDQTYAWPDQAVGSTIDLPYFALYMDAALLQYFALLTDVGPDITPVSGFPNRIITSDAAGFANNGPSYPRNTLLKGRDVQVGDSVYVNDGTNSLYTTVRGLIADVIATSISAATADAGNTANQGASNANAQIAGASNDISITAVASGSYQGLPTGDINEVYTITVTTPSVGGNATTARFSVTSASGRDNQASVTPSAFAAPTAIGTRGMTATWSNTVDDFVVGQQWTVTVHEAFTKPSVLTSAGTYTGSVTQTYIIKVTLGGTFAGSPKPQITCTTNLGGDASGPTNVTASAGAVTVGSLGITIAFTGTELNYGDLYYITATGPTAGAYRTIALQDNLPIAMLSDTEMNLYLSIIKNIVVPEDNIGAPPAVDWVVDQSDIVVKAGVTAGDPTLLNTDGSPFYVPVVSGPNTLMYAQYREWLVGLVNVAGVFTPVGNSVAIKAAIIALLGPVSPDNALAYGLWVAAQNSNFQPIGYTAVGDPTVLGNWTAAFDIYVGLPIYSLVPLSYDPAVQAATKVQIDAQSADPTLGSWCRGWFAQQAIDSIVVVNATTTTDHAVAQATLQDNPAEVGTQYTYLTCTTGNAQFVTNGVLPGDVVRYLYTVDSFGNTVWTEFIVDSVASQNTLVLKSPGNATPVSSTQKFEIWRNLTKNQIATNYAAVAEAFVDKRLLLVWPDQAETADGTVDGFYLAAAYAAFTAGICPHQGVQGIPITGFTGVPRSVNFFSNAQLNTLKAGGVFVITQDGSGNVYCQDALTTDLSSTENKLEVVQRDIDTTQHVLFNQLAVMFGVANLTTDSLSVFQSSLQSAAEVMLSGTLVDRLGTMITSFDIVDIRISSIVPDNLIVQYSAGFPFPIDSLLLTLDFAVGT